MLLTAERINAAEAHRIGLVSAVVPDGALRDEAQALATRIAGHGRLALECVKAATYRGFDMSLDAGLAVEAEFNARVAGGAEQIERANAFADRSARR
jgi:E-phenylitaconyl-CoA hydratase